jgi:hypothetical protein
MRFVTWNVWSVYMAGFFTAAAREFSKYKLDSVVSRGLGGTKGAQ